MGVITKSAKKYKKAPEIARIRIIDQNKTIIDTYKNNL